MGPMEAQVGIMGRPYDDAWSQKLRADQMRMQVTAQGPCDIPQPPQSPVQAALDAMERMVAHVETLTEEMRNRLRFAGALQQEIPINVQEPSPTPPQTCPLLDQLAYQAARCERIGIALQVMLQQLAL